MKKPTLEQLVARTTNILANLVTVIQKRGDYNLDEYSNKIAALYSSQEPQKSEKQKVADLLGVPLSEVHTLDIQDGKLVEIVDVPQSVSTPTDKFPKIVCLCGSTRFSEAFQKAQFDLTMAGVIVLTIGCNLKTDAELFKNYSESELKEIKTKLDELHKRKIDLANEVLILNVGGYIGESTRSEINYAKEHGKEIKYLEPIS